MKIVTVIIFLACFATCARRDMERIHYEVAKAKAHLQKKKQEQQFMEGAEMLEVVQQEKDKHKETKENVEMETSEATDATEAGPKFDIAWVKYLSKKPHTTWKKRSGTRERRSKMAPKPRPSFLPLSPGLIKRIQKVSNTHDIILASIWNDDVRTALGHLKVFATQGLNMLAEATTSEGISIWAKATLEESEFLDGACGQSQLVPALDIAIGPSPFEKLAAHGEAAGIPSDNGVKAALEAFYQEVINCHHPKQMKAPVPEMIAEACPCILAEQNGLKKFAEAQSPLSNNSKILYGLARTTLKKSMFLSEACGQLQFQADVKESFDRGVKTMYRGRLRYARSAAAALKAFSKDKGRVGRFKAALKEFYEKVKKCRESRTM